MKFNFYTDSKSTRKGIQIVVFKVGHFFQNESQTTSSGVEETSWPNFCRENERLFSTEKHSELKEVLSCFADPSRNIMQKELLIGATTEVGTALRVHFIIRGFQTPQDNLTDTNVILIQTKRLIKTSSCAELQTAWCSRQST